MIFNWEFLGMIVAAILSLVLLFKTNAIPMDFNDFKDFYKLLGRKGFGFVVIQVCITAAYFYAELKSVTQALQLFYDASNWNLLILSGANVMEWGTRAWAAKSGKPLDPPKVD